ncbi:MAG TPA: NADH-quinone oxidoreductase subunit NuoE [Verrucomicrobiota bacterium]|nr:NADH-quinone oxidoreductase subunit NuoE [Verrucomicrobiota bacterium]
MSQALEAILARYPGAERDKLIPILQEAQAAEGYLSEASIVRIGKHLNLPAAKIYGVATFYNQFRFQPKGRHHIMICRGTACHVKGSAKVLDTLTRTLRIAPGQTTRDGRFSLEVVACMGACALAPALNINGEFFPKVSPSKIVKLLDNCRAQDAAMAQEAAAVPA